MGQTTFDIFFEDITVATDVNAEFVPMIVRGLITNYPGDIDNFAKVWVRKHGYEEALAAAKKAEEEAKKQAEADKDKVVDEPSKPVEG